MFAVIILSSQREMKMINCLNILVVYPNLFWNGSLERMIPVVTVSCNCHQFYKYWCLFSIMLWNVLPWSRKCLPFRGAWVSSRFLVGVIFLLFWHSIHRSKIKLSLIIHFVNSMRNRHDWHHMKPIIALLKININIYKTDDNYN
jgi:hypothetical protein